MTVIMIILTPESDINSHFVHVESFTVVWVIEQQRALSREGQNDMSICIDVNDMDRHIELHILVRSCASEQISIQIYHLKFL